MGKATLEVIIGDDVQFIFEWVDSNGDPVDLTASTVVFWATQGGGNTTFTLTVGVDADITIPDPTDGSIYLTLSDARTADFLPGVQDRYRLYRTIAGNTETLVYGPILAIDPETAQP